MNKDLAKLLRGLLKMHDAGIANIALLADRDSPPSLRVKYYDETYEDRIIKGRDQITLFLDHLNQNPDE